MASTTELWEELTTHVHGLVQLGGLQGLAAWDQQVYMPPESGEARGEQLAFLSGLEHERACAPAYVECLASLRERTSELTADQARGVETLSRLQGRLLGVPRELVERLARLSAKGFGAWAEAREAGDFGVLEPVLTEIVAAVRERAACFAEGGDLYGALVEVYDPGVTPAWLTATFERLRSELRPLLEGIREAAPLPALDGFSIEPQLGLAREVAGALGYDLGRGRIDVAEHPFTVVVAGADVRITVHPAEDLMDMLGGVIHETGHALYEQGIPRGLPGVSFAASTGLHESQSRFWENVIGRSRPFLSWLRGPLARAYGQAPPLEALVAAANRVEPGFIRVAADEVTYNLHVGLRFDLERQLFAASPLAVADLPEAWNAAMARDLGLEVTDPVKGVLQDVHWATGAFGYFPSYTLGNLYAASLSKALEQALPEMWEQIGRGEFGPVLAWLRENVHGHGARKESPDLVDEVTGGRDQVADLIDHLWARHGALYNL